MLGDKKFEHPSFGVVGLSRVSGNATLFGSSVRHQHFISLTIKNAALIRSLHHDRISAAGRDEIIRVSMSAVQLGEMLTNMNVGEGTPCTIERMMMGGKYAEVEDPPSVVSTKQTYEEEFKEEAKQIAVNLREALKSARELEAKPTTTKTERKDLTHKLEMVLQEIEANMPFLVKQFNEKIEKVVGEAKGEIEAFHSHVIHQTGLQAIQSPMPKELNE